MPKFYLTFGMNHLDKDGKSLFHNYVVIEAANENAARDMMDEARGSKWAFVYTEEMRQQAIDRFNLKQLSLSDVTLEDKD